MVWFAGGWVEVGDRVGHRNSYGHGLLLALSATLLFGCPSPGVYFRVEESDFESTSKYPWHPFEGERKGVSIRIVASQEFGGDAYVHIRLKAKCDSAFFLPSQLTLRDVHEQEYKLSELKVSNQSSDKLVETDSNRSVRLYAHGYTEIETRWIPAITSFAARGGRVQQLDTLVLNIGTVRCVNRDSISFGTVKLIPGAKMGFT